MQGNIPVFEGSSAVDAPIFRVFRRMVRVDSWFKVVSVASQSKFEILEDAFGGFADLSRGSQLTHASNWVI